MNPLTNIKNVQKLNDRELELGIIGKKSWHDEYKDSAWIFVGGLPFDLSEGDILCVFSQYGEIVNINLVRDHKTGKSKGFAFICFEDQRSTVLCVDNLNGIKILGRTIRVDHVKDYKVPKEYGDEDELTKKVRSEGVAPKLESSNEEEEDNDVEATKTEKKAKKKKKKKDRKRKRKEDSSSNDEASSSTNQVEHQNGDHVKLEVKKEKFDPGYDKAVNPMKIRDERGRERKPQTSHSRDHQSKSGSRSSTSLSPTPSNNNRTTGAVGNKRHDSDSEPDGSRHAREPHYRDNRGSNLGGGSHGRANDGVESGGERDQMRSRRREDSRERDPDRGRSYMMEREDRHARREGNRERRRGGSSDRVRERSRERDRGSHRDIGRTSKQDRHHSRKDYDRERDKQR